MLPAFGSAANTIRWSLTVMLPAVTITSSTFPQGTARSQRRTSHASEGSAYLEKLARGDTPEAESLSTAMDGRKEEVGSA